MPTTLLGIAQSTRSFLQLQATTGRKSERWISAQESWCSTPLRPAARTASWRCRRTAHLHLRLKPDTHLDTRLAQAREYFQSIAVALATRHKLSALVMGCTEIPLALKQMAGLNLVDPARLLAQALAQRAYAPA